MLRRIPRARPHVLVTAGPTREYLDPVRFITNRSTGELGVVLATEARRRGWSVTLLLGAHEPPSLSRFRSLHGRANLLRFETTRDLEWLLARTFWRSDALFMTAAVGDFAPERPFSHKLKRRPALRVKFRATRDLVAALAKRKGRRVVVGFSLETDAWRKHARLKKARKRVDILVATRAAARHDPFGSSSMDVFLLDGQTQRSFRRLSKQRLARLLLDRVAHRLQASPRWRNWQTPGT